MKNVSYSWTVTDGWSSSAGDFGAYADYNDLSDKCRNNSIAIGMRFPDALTGMDLAGSGERITLYTSIIAPKGLVSRSIVSGNVQAVNDGQCRASTWMSLTDCMGVHPISWIWGGYPPGEYNRATLNINRGWTAPGLCWSTNKVGENITATASSCP